MFLQEPGMMEAQDAIRHQVRRGWELTSAQYAIDRPQVFQRFGDRLVELLNPSPGQRVLDVGAGTGVVALRAAEQVGAHGQVIAVDFALAMVSQTRAAARGKWRNVLPVQMDAEFLALPGESFDLIACAFSLFQFVDMARALTEMHRVLKPEGCLGLSNWGPDFFTPVALMQRDLFREYKLRPLLANPITFKREQMRALLTAAGLGEVELFEDHVELWFDRPEEIWDWNYAMGPFPIMLERQLTAELRQELERRYVEMLRPLATPKGIACTFHPLYALARRAR
jgi:ubiquinone/menaquinone biosynthesis C-methylase UbiE